MGPCHCRDGAWVGLIDCCNNALYRGRHWFQLCRPTSASRSYSTDGFLAIPLFCVLPHPILVALQKEQHMAELQNQQASFEQQKALLKEQLAHAVRFASDQKTSFDSQMANMKKAYEKMACEHASDQRKAGVVATQVRSGIGGDVDPGGWPALLRCTKELFNFWQDGCRAPHEDESLPSSVKQVKHY